MVNCQQRIMMQRLNYFQQSSELTKKLMEFGALFQKTTIEEPIRMVPGSSDKAFGLDKANLE
ncbi:Hypothetical protein H16_B1423 [Cupriavidus necator H16]|uniref:Uncharacterized protein n=2 Tax=Cupriavidus necator TaxID=106590 RepID=Q0K1B2_CUPNH|nr:Hypothetical protein H16_B1423 [Cupriavidus necator H16]